MSDNELPPLRLVYMNPADLAEGEWRPVVGYEGMYEVSSHGQIRSMARYARVGHGSTRSVPAKAKTLSQHQHGYLAVNLNKGGKGHGFLVHRVVAESFIGPIPEGCEVNHKDGDKKNNRVQNLEIVTRQQNIDHAVRTGLIANQGEKNTGAKLTAVDVAAIRTAYSRGGYQVGGKGYKAIGREFGISWGTVRHIIKRRTWQHIPDAAPFGVA